MMIFWHYWFVLSFYVSGMFSFCLNSRHLLVSLLALEFMVLSLFLMFVLLIYQENSEYYLAMIYLVFSVCEGALGLGLLVGLIKSFGNDFVSSVSLMLC